MNKQILKQLKKVKSPLAKVDGKIKNINQLTGNEEELWFSKDWNDPDKIHFDILYAFTFENYIVKPPKDFDLHNNFNNGIAPPFKIMYGRAKHEKGKLLYLECYGINIETSSCLHCFKYGNVNSICENCRNTYGEDLEKIKWEGYIPKVSIKIAELMEDIEE